jgi:hypothetical protein
MSRLTPRIRILAAVVIVSAFSAGVTSVITAGATTPNTTYYACLKAGKLTQVGTSAPTCKGTATQISWNSQGSPGPVSPTTYDWSGTFPSGADMLTASTFLPTGSTVNLVSGSITGNFTSCQPTIDLEVFDGQPAPEVAEWLPDSNVTGATPSSTGTVTVSTSEPMEWQAFCGGGPGPVPSFSFKVVFNVAAPPTTYS